MGLRAAAFLLVLQRGAERQDVPAGPVVRAARVVAGVLLDAQEVVGDAGADQRVVVLVRAEVRRRLQTLEDAEHVLEGAVRSGGTPDVHAVVARVDAGTAGPEVDAEVRRVEGRLIRVIGARVERSVQLLPFGRHEQTAAPDVEVRAELDLRDAVEQVELGEVAVLTEDAIGVELEFEILMNLTVDVDTSVVDVEILRPIVAARRLVLRRGEREAAADAEADPLRVVD